MHMEIKICPNEKCVFSGIAQSIESFYKNKNKKDGLSWWCKTCEKQNNKVRKPTQQQYFKIYYEKNKEKAKITRKKRYDKNKEKVLFQQKNYRKTHRRQINDHLKTKRQNDPSFKLTSTLRSTTSRAIRGYKVGSFVNDLGCTIQELKERLESMFVFVAEENEMMTWHNHGKLWHIDHIIPLCAFDLNNRQQFLKAVHFSNLRPLWAKQNCSERDRGLSRNKKKET